MLPEAQPEQPQPEQPRADVAEAVRQLHDLFEAQAPGGPRLTPHDRRHIGQIYRWSQDRLCRDAPVKAPLPPPPERRTPSPPSGRSVLNSRRGPGADIAEAIRQLYNLVVAELPEGTPPPLVLGPELFDGPYGQTASRFTTYQRQQLAQITRWYWRSLYNRDLLMAYPPEPASGQAHHHEQPPPPPSGSTGVAPRAVSAPQRSARDVGAMSQMTYTRHSATPRFAAANVDSVMVGSTRAL